MFIRAQLLHYADLIRKIMEAPELLLMESHSNYKKLIDTMCHRVLWVLSPNGGIRGAQLIFFLRQLIILMYFILSRLGL